MNDSRVRAFRSVLPLIAVGVLAGCGSSNSTGTAPTPASSTLGSRASAAGCETSSATPPGGPSAHRIRSAGDRAFRVDLGSTVRLKVRVARVRRLTKLDVPGGAAISPKGGLLAVEYRVRNSGSTAVVPSQTVNRAFLLQVGHSQAIASTSRTKGCEKADAAFAVLAKVADASTPVPPGGHTTTGAIYPLDAIPKSPTWLAKPPGLKVVLPKAVGAS